LVFFTTHYLMLRGFYALERTRTVFWVQCVIAATNIVLAVAFTRALPPSGTAPGLVLAYGGAYLVGALGSYLLLRHVLAGLESAVLGSFLARMLPAAALAGAAGWAVRLLVGELWPAGGKAVDLVVVVGVTAVGAASYLGLARLFRIAEVTGIVREVTSRLHR
jgi:putative peptidoglycan lipid II flippase